MPSAAMLLALGKHHAKFKILMIKNILLVVTVDKFIG